MKNYRQIKNDFDVAVSEFTEINDISTVNLTADDLAVIFRDNIASYFGNKYGVSMAEWPANSETIGFVLLSTEINGMPDHGLRILSEGGLKI